MSDEQVQTFEETVNAFYPDSNAEPLDVLTEEESTDEDPVEEVELTNDTEDEASDEESDDDNADEDGDILVYDINGKEYTAKDIERLETDDKSRQADYTRKTQALAEDVKGLDAAITKTNDLAAQLEVLVSEDNDINWAELKEDDPDRYIELKERADNRKSKLDEVKANNQTSNEPKFDAEAERSTLIEANPQWQEDGKPTQVYKDEMAALQNFYVDGGWTQEQVNLVNSNAKLSQLVIDSIRESKKADIKTEKVSKARKKIIATPKSGKTKENQTNLSAEETFYGKQ